MIITHTIAELRTIIANAKKEGKSIGLVPTMGALHEGHASLMKRSVTDGNFTVVSIFVNPIQFGPNEDYDKYPRTLDADAKLCEAQAVDVIFAPSVEELLGSNRYTFVDVNELSKHLCGAKRKGHFQGVCTIVSKFLNITTPDKAYFGKKDIQQLYIIKRMVTDLNFPTEIIGCPIVRDDSGLALSSRNKYLTEEQRKSALSLNISIKKAIEAINQRENSSQKIINVILSRISKVNGARIDYVEIVNEELSPVDTVRNGCIIALAIYIGDTRLIDNHVIGEPLCF